MGGIRGRCIAGVLLGVVIAAQAARAQTYPMFPDRTRRAGWWAAYSWQGPLPIQQQPGPLTDADLEAWSGTVTPPRPRVEEAAAHAIQPRRIRQLPAGLHEHDFYASRDLPRGTREALVQVLPSGGLELYLLLDPGAQLLPHLAACARELVLLQGEGEAAVGSDAPRPLREGDRLGVPSQAPHELRCGDRGPCLIQVRTDGPLRLRWLPRR